MIDQWDRFAASATRTLDALGFTDTVEVYQPTESYVPGEGYEVTYPDDPTATLDGALDPPSSTPDIDPGGTTETADLTIYIADSVGVDFNTAGESGEAETGVEVDGLRYVVDAIDNQQDGLLGLACDEVDRWA
jgi:hypothetical protein